MQNLNRRMTADNQRAISRAAKLQQDLMKLSSVKAATEQYKALQKSVQDNSLALVQARLKSAQLKKAYQDQYNQVEKMRQSYDRLKAVYKDNKNSMPTDQRVAMQNQIRAAKEELKAQEKVLKSMSSENVGHSRKTLGLESQLSRQRAELAQLQASLRSAGMSLSDMAAHERQLQNAINQTTAALERQQRQDMHRQNFANAQQNMANAYGNFQNSLSTAQTIMSPFAGAVERSMDFEAAMSKVKALSQMKNIRAGNLEQVNAEMAELTAEAKRLGATTEYTATQAAESMSYLAMAGWGKDQIMAATSQMLNLATATKTELPRAADIVSDLMTASGVTAGEQIEIAGKKYEAAAHFMDMFTFATVRANTNSEDLFQTMKYSAPIAKAYGMSMHELAAANMVVANTGIKGSMAGTGMRTGLLRLVGPPKKAKAALAEMGMTASDAMKEMAEAQQAMQAMGIDTAFLNDDALSQSQKFTRVMTEMSAKMKGMSNDERLANIDAIFGKNAATFWTSLLDPKNFEQYQAYLAEMDQGIEGYATDTANVMRDNLKTKFALLESAFDASAQSIGDVLIPYVSKGVTALTELFNKFNDFAQANPNLIAGFAGVAAAISAVIVAAAGFGVAASGVQFLASSFAMLKAGALESAAAQRIAQAASMSWSGIGAGISGAFTGMLGKIQAARAAMVSFFATAAATNGASVITSLQGITSAFLNVARAGMAFVFSPIGVALMALAAAGYYCYTHWSQVAPVFESLAGTLGGALQGAITTISAAFENLNTAVSRLAPGFSSFGEYIFAGLSVTLNYFANLAATIISTFSNAIAAVISLFGGLGNAIASALAGDWGKAAEHFKNAFVNAGKFVVEAIKSLFGGLADTFTNFFKPLDIMRGIKSDGATSGGGSFGTPQAPQPQQIDNSALIAAIANAVETTQKQTPEADWSKVTAAISTAVESIKQDPKTDIVPLLQQVSTAIESVKKENPNADTSKLESVLSAAISQIQAQQAAQVEQKNLEVEPLQAAFTQTADSMSQFAPQMQMAAEGVTQMTAGQQAFNAEVQNSQGTLAATNAQVQASQGALSGFNGALASTNGGLANLASSSSSAAGAISGLGSAAQAAVSALQSAGANAAAAVSAAAANIGTPKANFAGGIYSKGAFLTTFAEKSPEAAIPIDKSERAIDLWTKTGQMLGQLPGKSFAPEQPSTAQRISTIERAQRGRLEQVRAQYEAAKRMRNVELGMRNGNFPLQYDELGNIRGLNGLKDNIITKDDDIQVAREKKAAQMAEWRKTHSTQVESPKVPKSIFSSQVKTPDISNIYEMAMGKPTFPQTNSTQVESPKVPKSIFSGRVKTPDISNIPMTQTQARNYDTGLNIGDIFGAIGERLGGGGILSSITERISAGSGGGIIPQLINNLPQQSDSSPIDLHFEINIQGNANAEDVEQGIRQSIPLLEETFERKLANYQHEQQRRSF